MTDGPVTRIQLGDKEILLVATAHVSKASIELVKQVIEEEKPDSVCIELDEKRYENIKNPKAFEETDLIQVIKKKQAGFMLANLALSSYQKRIAKQLDTTVGGEMLQGIESAEATGAQLVLADRDIQTTFLRVWRKLGLWEKSKLLASLLFSFDDEDENLSESDLKEMLESDILESMLHSMRKEFPKIGDILISERDQFLSDKIKRAPGKKVVAILGGAHVPGVTKEIRNEIDIDAINTVPEKSPVGKIVGWGISLLIIGLLVYSFVLNVETGLRQLGLWALWSGGLAALFTLLVLGHPLSILTSLVAAPFTTINPVLAVGWFSGLVQAWVQKPTVKDLQNVQTDIFSLKGLAKNKVLKVLLVTVFANIGASIGTFVAGADLIRNLFA